MPAHQALVKSCINRHVNKHNLHTSVEANNSPLAKFIPNLSLDKTRHANWLKINTCKSPCGLSRKPCRKEQARRTHWFLDCQLELLHGLSATVHLRANLHFVPLMSAFIHLEETSKLLAAVMLAEVGEARKPNAFPSTPSLSTDVARHDEP
jgi:hypothetical protein